MNVIIGRFGANWHAMHLGFCWGRGFASRSELIAWLEAKS